MEHGRKMSQDELRKYDARQAVHLKRIKNLEALVKDVDMKHRGASAQRTEAHQEQIKNIVANNFRLVENINRRCERRSRHVTAASEALAQAEAEHVRAKEELNHSHVSQLRALQQLHESQIAQVSAQCEYILTEKRREMGQFVADCNNYRRIVSQKLKVRHLLTTTL